MRHLDKALEVVPLDNGRSAGTGEHASGPSAGIQSLPVMDEDFDPVRAHHFLLGAVPGRDGRADCGEKNSASRVGAHGWPRPTTALAASRPRALAPILLSPFVPPVLRALPLCLPMAPLRGSLRHRKRSRERCPPPTGERRSRRPVVRVEKAPCFGKPLSDSPKQRIALDLLANPPGVLLPVELSLNREVGTGRAGAGSSFENRCVLGSVETRPSTRHRASR